MLSVTSVLWCDGVDQSGQVSEVLLGPQRLALLRLDGVQRVGPTQPGRVLLQEVLAPVYHVLLRVSVKVLGCPAVT